MEQNEVLKGLEKADPNYDKKMEDANPVDRAADNMDRENESAKGVTEYIRNIFGE